MQFNKNAEKDQICLFTNSKFMGIELSYNRFMAWANREPNFHVQITLGWIRFWWVRYKS